MLFQVLIWALVSVLMGSLKSEYGSTRLQPGGGYTTEEVEEQLEEVAGK